MQKKVIVIGAGINGLVAANYLRRGGCEVLQLERKEKVGGACTVEWMSFGGSAKYPIPTGASVFGMMQDFIFKETGLCDRIEHFRAEHPPMVYFGDEAEPLFHFDDANKYSAQVREKWGEQGDVLGYLRDLEKVRQFLLCLYRDGAAPSLKHAQAVLGHELTARWISGSAKDLFDYYFTADRTKIYEAMSVTESGPVELSEPFTAFTLAVMNAGSVLDGYWGFVKGALWRVPLALAEINQELGVDLLTAAQVLKVDPNLPMVEFFHQGRVRTQTADAIFFATDPVTAARLTGDQVLQNRLAEKRFLGSSGKVVLVFRQPVRWKGDRGAPQFDAANRFFFEPMTLARFEESSQAIRDKRCGFSPSSFQVYVEGGAMRQMGWHEPYDYLSIFAKDFALGKTGAELPEVKEAIQSRILARLENPEALVGSVLFTPRDLQETFFFPEGNIDHMELTQGQSYFSRTFSEDPERAFYQLGAYKNLFYCGAGSFPCGSVAGTAGSLAARQWLSAAASR